MISKKEDQDTIWSIYYDMFYSVNCSLALKKHVEELLDWSKDSESWMKSEVGSFLQIGSIRTFEAVREVWKAWAQLLVNRLRRTILSQHFRKSLQVTREDWHGKPHTLGAVRSGGPLSPKIMAACSKCFDHYWKTGVTENISTEDFTANPTFSISKFGWTFIVYYGTNPLAGFHLATAFAPFEAGAKTPPDLTESFTPLVEAAKQEFNLWCQAFRVIQQNEKCRVCFFVDDPLDLCGNLLERLLRLKRPLEPESVPIDPITLTRLCEADFTLKGYYFSIACRYNVIDVSDLIDHLGVYNVLLSIAPLVHRDFTSCVYIETLQVDQFNPRRGEKALYELFGVDPTFIFLVLGIAPADYVSGLTGQSHTSEDLLSKVTSKDPVHGRLTWKKLVAFNPQGADDFDLSKPSETKFTYDISTMAAVLLKVYNKMFETEDISFLLEGSKATRNNEITQHNTRATFSLFLNRLRNITSPAVDWHPFMTTFMGLLALDEGPGIRFWYRQEQYIMNHIFGAQWFDPVPQEPLAAVQSFIELSGNTGDLEEYCPDLKTFDNDIDFEPPIVCLSVAVPLERFYDLLYGDVEGCEAPPLRITLHATAAHMMEYFGSVRQHFGKLLPHKGTRQEGILDIQEGPLIFVEDLDRWWGKGDVIFSCLVPTWWLLYTSCEIYLEIVTMPATMKYMDEYGFNMRIFETNIYDEERVRVTTEFPHREFTGGTIPWMDIRPIDWKLFRIDDDSMESDKENIPNNGQNPAVKDTQAYNTFELIIEPDPDFDVERISYRWSVAHEAELAALLKGKADVKTARYSQSTFVIKLGPRSHIITFPYTIGTDSNLAIARTSGYIELNASIANLHRADDIPRYIRFPVALSQYYKPSVACWSLHRINPDASPQVVTDGKDTETYGWINTSFDLMFSYQERIDRDAKLQMIDWYLGDTLVEMKQSIYTMAMQHAQALGKRASFFMLYNQETVGKGYMLIFIKALRLDLSGNTMFADCGLVPLIRGEMLQLVPHVGAVIRARRLTDIHTSDRQSRLWLQSSVSMVERCRTWQHKGNQCEYYKLGNMPLFAPNLWIGAPSICSCGKGIFPPSFQEDPLIGPFLPHATRIVLGPLFSSPCTQPAENFEEFEKSVKDWIKASEAPMIAVEKPGKCSVCKKPGSKEEGLISCPRCHVVHYCSKKCQKKDWNNHKLHCIPA
ncbi:hypothetical protein TWF696_008598 [Orbilia brochopaga]|uniref:MYND-type domain-containing protein n=1 Tax=Orbilia brochopaga TaxID=3140254 RepID=A0AAV9UHK6_9PEZI